MAKSALIWILLSFHFPYGFAKRPPSPLLFNPSPSGQPPRVVTPPANLSVGEYFQEAVDLMDRTRWRYFLPENTDIDQDGQLSDLELQQKFNSYMGEVFKLIDHDKDNSIVEEELQSLKLDIPHLTKAVDIALENFPLKPFFLAADANQDGVYDENDFYIPENVQENVQMYVELENLSRSRTVTVHLPYGAGNHTVIVKTQYKIDEHTKEVFTKGFYKLVGIGYKEGTVLCKSLGFDGLERVLKADEMSVKETNYDESNSVIRSCRGYESRIEDCSRAYSSSEEGMGVICKGEKLGAIHLEGGINNSSGDIFLGNKSLSCHPEGFEEANSEVICRELGYPGLVKTTVGSSFTGIQLSRNDAIKIRTFFKCNGNEQKLSDCPVDTSGECHGDWNHVLGVVCATDDNPGINRDLSQLMEWNSNSRIWEEFGRLLFIGDANVDGKLTLEELATKVKELMTKILEFLDQNQDGKLSLDDINLNLSIDPIHNLLLQVFDDVTAGQGEFDLYDMKIRDQHMDKWIGLKAFHDARIGLKILDKNWDRKLTADDRLLRPDNSLLITMLSEKLDKNQDGNIQREELKHFTDYMFHHLDMDNNGAVTLEDVYSLLRKNGFHCFQVGALRSFIKRFLATINKETKNIFGYIFNQFDIDGNGKISSEEFEKMHLPCDRSRNYHTVSGAIVPYHVCNDQGYGYTIPYHTFNNYHDYDPNARMACEDMFENCLGRRLRNLIDSFPDLEMDSYYGVGGPDQYRRETAKNKMASAACEILS